MQGFTYNGIHCSNLGIHYIPDENERGDFFSSFEVIDYERAWNDGGGYFKSRVKSKVFNLSCYYENITHAQREKIIRWLDRRTSGELIFDSRPYAKYFVRPTKTIAAKDYLQVQYGEKLYSGTFTATFTAYDPFATLLYETLDETTNNNAREETALIYSSQMPPAVSVGDTSCLVYNPGTEVGHSIIKFAGRTGSSDMIINNTVTGDVCVLRAGTIVENGAYLIIDSKTGRVTQTDWSGTVLKFEFHDKGYIKFAPAFPIVRDVQINTTANSRTITSTTAVFDESMNGQYIYLDNAWRYIGLIISPTQANVNTPLSITGTETTTIATLNHLTIVCAADASIETLEIECKAEVR